ncbi:three-Cys-motif partner protein TcmP [Actinomycetospora lutea]|uniref:three-Cys-motif partner protein TcmP n=1 Tax=Actinomycetospora lutea TaxID=663604 RepID=UPI0023655F04|nr:three-Cys-motif partner protein TcmP [Actinomycetospora lutea]MDD7941679.1 three-Cys-motif partner protein TcmP [Actinomycetospora lutea]
MPDMIAAHHLIKGALPGMPKSTTWELPAHTRAKHDLLKYYLGGWFPILSRYNERVVFLDGFAGPGVYQGGEPGSPQIALDALLKHNYFPQMSNKQFVFIFNEMQADRCDSLAEIVAEFQRQNSPWPNNVGVSVNNSSFEEVASEMLQYLEQQKANLAPTFAFVDPFGVKGIPMALLARLLAFRQCELFVYFDFNTVNRFAAAGNIDDRLTELFGTDLYKNARDLAGTDRKLFLHNLYQDQLRSVCGFPYVHSFEMIREDGKTGYFLFYGTRSVTGLRVMKDAMWRVDPGGGQKFSDFFAGQDVLFDVEVDTYPLRLELQSHFAGNLVSVEELEQYVLVNTPYAASHLKRLTLKRLFRI